MYGYVDSHVKWFCYLAFGLDAGALWPEDFGLACPFLLRLLLESELSDELSESESESELDESELESESGSFALLPEQVFCTTHSYVPFILYSGQNSLADVRLLGRITCIPRQVCLGDPVSEQKNWGKITLTFKVFLFFLRVTFLTP